MDECLANHPNYFYNGIMQATFWMGSETKRTKIPAMLGNWNIVLYAGRAEFGGHEVRIFYLKTTEYYFRNLNLEEAGKFIYFLKVIGESSHPHVKHYQEMLKSAKSFLKKPSGGW